MKKWRCSICARELESKPCPCGNTKYFDKIPEPAQMVEKTPSKSITVGDGEARKFEEGAK